MKIVTIIGARPQIIKAAALSRAVRSFQHPVHEVIVHTGQHYDANMSEVFIRELSIPQPDYNLGVGSGSHGKQTASMIEGIEQVLVTEQPDWLVVYGDTNSTLAGAVAASKLHVPIAHIEAGLRSFNKAMPEEVNRILCDHVSTLLFSPTGAGIRNLLREGFVQQDGPYHVDKPGVFHCGDLMYDNSLHFAGVAETQTDIATRLDLQRKPFLLATIHRNANTDDADRLNRLFDTLCELSERFDRRIILPLHPRTRKMMEQTLSAEVQDRINRADIDIVEPASFLEMIVLESRSELVITDSGGVQKEAYYFKKPCIILRPETEWIELVELGCAALCDADRNKILESYAELTRRDLKFPSVFGDGKAAEFILSTLWKNRLKRPTEGAIL